MNLYRDLAFPMLKNLDPEKAHDQTAYWLEKTQNTAAGRMMLKRIGRVAPSPSVNIMGLNFPNVLGIAAGFDKNVKLAPGLACLGFGHIEVGTLTPKPQEGNPKPRIFRLHEQKALLNRMGFPNCGVEEALPRLKEFSQRDAPWIMGVSIGKQKTTELDKALDDYLFCMKKVYSYSDYLAVNISSPNTPGLRELQGGQYLHHLLDSLVKAGKELAEKKGIKPKPIAVKIAPDLDATAINEVVESVLETGIDGLIVGNTTLSRKGVPEEWQTQQGGISGRPLRSRSTALIASIRRRVSAERLPIIGVGGISTSKDAREKLEAGAQVLQVYTGLIYEGPAIAGKILNHL